MTARFRQEGPGNQAFRGLAALLWLILWTTIGTSVPYDGVIEQITPEQAFLKAGGSLDAAVTVTSGSGCLSATPVAGLDVSFDPSCGQGTWTSTLTVSDIGDPPSQSGLVIELSADGTVLDTHVWDVQIVTLTAGPGPISTSTTTPPLATQPPTSSPTTAGPVTTVTVPPPGTVTLPPISGQDPVVAAFREAGIAFNTPASLELEESTLVELILGVGQPGQEVEDSVVAPGEIESHEIATTCETTARLQGLNFEVQPYSDETQYVCAGNQGVWTWEIIGRKAGRHNLTLTISALIDDNPPVTIEIFKRDIVIEVSWGERIFGPLVKNLGVFVGAFVAALGTAGGAMALQRIRRRRVGKAAMGATGPGRL